MLTAVTALFLCGLLAFSVCPVSAGASGTSSGASSGASSEASSGVSSDSALPADSSAASASSRRTVRVGLPDTDTVSKSGGDNVTVAFEKDYLLGIAEYANWDYEYKAAPWNECLEMLKNGEIDVLLDVSKTDERMAFYDYSAESMGTEMCYMDGYEAARQIRLLGRDDAGKVPIIAMTADAFAEDVRKCLDAGMNGHIAKPVEPDALFRTLEEHIRT